MAAPHDHLLEKSLSNLQEVAARHGKVFLVSDKAGIKQAGQGAVRHDRNPRLRTGDPAHHHRRAAAVARLSCGRREGHGRRPAAQSRQVGYGRVVWDARQGDSVMSGFDRRGWYVVAIPALPWAPPAWIVGSAIYDLQQY